MNILFDHQIFQRQRFGGISRYFFELLKRLSKDPRFNVSLFLGFYINAYCSELDRQGFGRCFGTKRPLVPKTGRIFEIINRILFEGFTRLEKPALDHQNHALYHQSYYETMAKRFRGQRAITVYDMIHELFPQSFPENNQIRHLKRNAVLAADKVLAISQTTKNDLIQTYGIAPERVRVVYLANSLLKEPALGAAVPSPYLLYVGERSGYKNFALLLRIFGRCATLKQNFHLVCFGGSPPTPSEHKLIAEFDLVGKVKFLTGDDEELARMYSHASVFVYPSKYEGFGMPPLEAMHYGCPVVASNGGSIPEIVGNAALLFDPHEPDDLEEKLKTLLSSESLAENLRRSGRQRESEFSWDRCYRETTAFYLE